MSRIARNKVIVRFSDVGRGKRTWEERVFLTEPGLYNAVRRKGALASRDVEFGEDEGLPIGGWIFAGMRAVGRWQVVGEPTQINGGAL